MEIYNWKSFSLKGYKEIDIATLNFNTRDINLQDIIPHFEDKAIILDFINSFSSFTITKQSKNLIDKIIDFYNLEINSTSLYALAAILQNDYSYHNDNPINTSKEEFIDIEFLNLELGLLFDLVKIRLNNESLENYESITFKIGNNRPDFVFKSSFIFKDLLNAFIKANGIDVNNFEKVKQDELSKILNVKFDKFLEYQKQRYILGLYSIIKSNQNLNNKDLRFIACFLLLSEIPISSIAKEITIPSDWKDVSTSDLNTLRKYINGEKDFSIKNLKQ